MAAEALVAAVLLALIVSLARELVSPAAGMLGALVVFVLLGLLPVEDAFVGFSSPATISIAGLYVVSRAMRDRCRLDVVANRVLGEHPDGERAVLLRLLPPIAAVSGVFNNTPLVATTGPVVRGWAERKGIAATHLLMPLSFAAILGGVLTLIGTGPNLVVAGMVAAAGHEPLGFFTLTPVTLPMALVGLAMIVLLAPRVLPDRRTPHERSASERRDYALRLEVEPGGPLEGRTLAEAGLRELDDAYVAKVVRDAELLDATPARRLQGGDLLLLVGNARAVPELLRRPGLAEAERAQTVDLEHAGTLVEVIVGANSRLVGSTLKRAAFRGRYGGAVIAIHRADHWIESKLGTVELRAGDALLVLADEAFVDRWQGDRDFALVIPHGDGTSSTDGAWAQRLTLGVFGVMVVMAASGLVPVATAIIGACAVLVATRLISFPRAVDSLDLGILLIVASAIGIARVVETSGLAATAAGWIELAAAIGGPLVALLTLVLVTLLLTELVTNVAAAALVLPIGFDVAARTGLDVQGVAVAVAVAASASFLTPIGYQTNTIVYGLGGYRFADYWRLGLPLTALTVVAVVGGVTLWW